MKLDHVGLVVDDLAAAQRFLIDILGFSFEREISIPGRLDAVFLRHGEDTIELLQLAARPAAGGERAPEHHIAIAVDDIEAAVGELRRAGAVTTADTPSLAGGAPSYFTRPESTAGLSIQLVESD